jgi:hypothetical protein
MIICPRELRRLRLLAMLPENLAELLAERKEVMGVVPVVHRHHLRCPGSSSPEEC